MLTEYPQTEELASTSRYARADLFVEDRPIEGFRRIILCRPTHLPPVADLASLMSHLGLTTVNPKVAKDYQFTQDRPPRAAAEPLVGKAVVPGILVVDQPWATMEDVSGAAQQLDVHLAGVEQMLILAHRHNLLDYSKLMVAGNGFFYMPGGSITGLANLWRDIGRDALGKPVRQGGLGLLPIFQEWQRDTVFPFVA